MSTRPGTLRIITDDANTPYEIGLTANSRFGNVEQTCPDGYTGDPIPANTEFGDTQAEADEEAEALLDCVEDGPTITGFSCVSRVGNGNLRGWSKWTNHNSGDRNRSKSTRATVSGGSSWSCATFYTGPVNLCNGAICGTYVRSILAAEATWNVASNAIATEQRYRLSLCGSDTDTDTYLSKAGLGNDPLSVLPRCEGVFPPAGNQPYIVNSPVTTTPTDWTRQYAYGTPSDNTCYQGNWGCGCTADVRGYVGYVPATLVHTLDQFDTVAAAQDRGSPSLGSDCTTEPGTFGSTNATSTTQIAFTSPKSVVVTINCDNLVNGQDYEISATLTKRDASTNALIGTETATITFTADGTTDTVDYDVPIETDVKVEFTSADSITAV